MRLNCSGKRSDKTYYRDNERDPHEEVEPTKHIVESFLPVYRLRRGNNILAKSLGEPFDSGRFKTQGGGGGEPLIHHVHRNSVHVNLTNNIGWIHRRLRLRLLLYVDRQRSIPLKSTGSQKRYGVKRMLLYWICTLWDAPLSPGFAVVWGDMEGR